MAKRQSIVKILKRGLVGSLIVAFGLIAVQYLGRFVLHQSITALPKNEMDAPLLADPQGVYPTTPSDSWNRIFHCLFTRTVKARVSEEFADGAPFTRTEVIMSRPFRVSARLFERMETGDRAIEPFYPSFLTSSGAFESLSQPRYSQLEKALTDALQEKATRAPLQRALMQNDIWAAYDILSRSGLFQRTDDNRLRERRDNLLHLLAQFIMRLALTTTEINSLPNNQKAPLLADLFAIDSEWVELQSPTERLHEVAADYRQATRVFIKPTSRPRNSEEFLNSWQQVSDPTASLSAVALIIQILLIDSNGQVVSTSLIYEAQFRIFNRSENGARLSTELIQYELSRKLFLTSPSAGGLVKLYSNAPAYLPSAGNDYGFASPQTSDPDKAPVLATLRSRCISCHGNQTATILSLRTDKTALPSVTQLNPADNERSFFVARRKTEREDYKALQQHWRDRP